MRSIPSNIRPASGKGKPLASYLRLVLATALLALLSACSTTDGVRNTSRSFTTVVVDAGHGGHDAGTRSSRLILEKDAALDIAKQLDARLRSAGFHTVLTRSTDNFVTLDNRAKISNRASNAIFVSVHLNEALPRPDIHGAETYYTSPQSLELAQRILRHMGSLPGGLAHGIHTAHFRVLRLNKNPAVLVECGYLSNGSEAARMASAPYRAQVAGAIADALVEQKKQ